jgi:hypothetical protein
MSNASKTRKGSKSKKPVSRDVYAVREASKREVGDIADKITRAPKKR